MGKKMGRRTVSRVSIISTGPKNYQEGLQALLLKICATQVRDPLNLIP